MISNREMNLASLVLENCLVLYANGEEYCYLCLNCKEESKESVSDIKHKEDCHILDAEKVLEQYDDENPENENAY